MTRRTIATLALIPVLLLAAYAVRVYKDRPIPPDEADGSSESSSFSLVEPNLYVGGRTLQPPPGTLAVLSLSYNQDIYTAPFHKYSSIPDGQPAPSLDWLKEQIAFIETQQKAGRQTYIHCDAGMSRGPMVTAAWLMYHHRWTRDEALQFLKQKRPIVGPNSHFMALLLDWEREIGLPPSSPPATAEYFDDSTFSQVDELLYVGGRTHQPPPNTAAVLSMSYTPDEYQVPFHQYSSIPDGGRAPSLDWLKQQVAFIDTHQKANRVTFIHCDAGISRGPMVTTAYLMFKNNWTRDRALDYLREKRPIIGPNIYFMDLLLDWEESLKR